MYRPLSPEFTVKSDGLFPKSTEHFGFKRTRQDKIDIKGDPILFRYIDTISKIKDKLERTDFEESIVGVMDIFGMINESSTLHVKYMLCMISIESLLISSKQESIAYKIGEKISFLVADEDWIKYAYPDLIASFKLKIDNSMSITEKRIFLNRIFGKLY